MSQLPTRLTAIIAATAAAGAAGAAIANAAGNGSATTPTAPTNQQAPPGAPGGGPGAGETALTGDTKAKVEAAALAKVPGTVIRSETDRGGVYEAHVRKSDGTEVEVKVNKDFEVTAVETHAGGRGGPGGRHGGPGMHGDLAAVAKALDVTPAKLRSALEAARPDKPADGSRHSETAAQHQAREAAMYAAVAKALGKDTAAVQKAFEAARPAAPTP
jgi:uncharacterized membrane protein YkoI